MTRREIWTFQALAAMPLVAAACWPLDYSEEDAVLYESAAATGGTGGSGGEGAGGSGGAAPVTDLFVDPEVGSDDGPGTADAPFKTLKRALMVAREGHVVHLHDGAYGSMNGDDFGTPVPHGVTLAAMTPGGAVLVGTGVETALDFEGDGAANGVQLHGFATGVRTGGNVALEALTLEENGVGVELFEDAQVTLDDSVIAYGGDGIVARDSAKLWATGVELFNVGSACDDAALRVQIASQVEIKESHFLGGRGIVRQSGSSNLILRKTTLQGLGLGCQDPTQAISSLTINTADGGLQLIESSVEDVPDYAIQLVSPNTHVHVIGGAVSGGILGAFVGSGSVNLSGATVSSDGGGCGLCGGLGLVTLFDTTIQGFGAGLWVGGNSVVVRSSEIVGNQIGVLVTNGSYLDLGTSVDDPGDNTITGNVQTGLQVTGTVAGVIQAVGNTWVPGTSPFKVIL